MLVTSKEKRQRYNHSYWKFWYEQNKERRQEYNRTYMKEWRRKIKRRVLTHYGNGKCACVKCGFINIRALSIDHLAGGGGREIRKLKLWQGPDFYRLLEKNGFPEGYQTLCMNCQWIKRIENEEYSRREST